MKKRVMSVFLAVIMAASICAIGLTSASASYIDYVDFRGDYTCKRYYFYMHDEWYNLDANGNSLHYTVDPANGEPIQMETGCAYWFGGDGLCESWQTQYQMKQAVADSHIYYIDVPSSVETIIFSNGVDGGMVEGEGLYGYNYQTVDVCCSYYEGDPNDPTAFHDSDVYPGGLDSMNNMIYVPDLALRSTNPYSGVTQFGGEWYFLHADGTWSTTDDGTVYDPTAGKGEDPIPLATITKVTTTKSSYTLTQTSTKAVSTNAKVKAFTPATNNGIITWASSNTKIFKIKASADNKTIKLTSVKPGTAYLRATNGRGERIANIKVTVVQRVTKVKLNRTSYPLAKKGKSVTLKATVTPTNATKKTVKWTTTNKKVATVNSKGKVVAKKKGTCYIKATATDGSKKYAKCKITVKK